MFFITRMPIQSAGAIRTIMRISVVMRRGYATGIGLSNTEVHLFKTSYKLA
jgi:hypothetical protein